MVLIYKWGKFFHYCTCLKEATITTDRDLIQLHFVIMVWGQNAKTKLQDRKEYKTVIPNLYVFTFRYGDDILAMKNTNVSDNLPIM